MSRIWYHQLIIYCIFHIVEIEFLLALLLCEGSENLNWKNSTLGNN
jgi:hypothetical protein